MLAYLYPEAQRSISPFISECEDQLAGPHYIRIIPLPKRFHLFPQFPRQLLDTDTLHNHSIAQIIIVVLIWILQILSPHNNPKRQFIRRVGSRFSILLAEGNILEKWLIQHGRLGQFCFDFRLIQFSIVILPVKRIAIVGDQIFCYAPILDPAFEFDKPTLWVASVAFPVVEEKSVNPD
ncbi:hypothetical protein AA313_de0205264 [Arthrobotrys entomopaga]|nr:hypothetical protein AA313_de0205264 [Arthrobotrys entomopaga]